MSTLTSATPTVVSLGIDRLLDTDLGLISGNRIGLVCNPASIDAKFRHTSDRLRDDAESTLAALFGPQHGFRSDLQDNMIETPHATRRAAPGAGLFALQRDARADGRDAARTSTSSSSICRTSAPASTPTSTRWPTACAPPRRHGVRVVVCDRPNPIGGEAVEGSRARREQWTSFVGQFPIPLRHGMTIGELARLFNDALRHRRALDVVPMDGWRRAMYFDETGPALGDAVAEHADARHARSSIRARCCSRARCCRRGGARRRPFELDRRAVDRRRAPRRRDERARAAGRALPAGVLRADVPEARAARRAAAARSTSPIARRSRRCGPPSS